MTKPAKTLFWMSLESLTEHLSTLIMQSGEVVIVFETGSKPRWLGMFLTYGCLNEIPGS